MQAKNGESDSCVQEITAELTDQTNLMKYSLPGMGIVQFSNTVAEACGHRIVGLG